MGARIKWEQIRLFDVRRFAKYLIGVAMLKKVLNKI